MSSLKLYLDSFERNGWHALMPTGLFYGITTNPLLARKAGLDYLALDWPGFMSDAASLGAHELHIQVHDVSDDALSFAAHRIQEAQSHALKIVIKVPLTTGGIEIAKSLKSAGYNVLMTACYHAKQYMVADQLGADFIAPYYGRMNEAGINAKQHLMQMKAMQNSISSNVRILVASLRSVEQMTELAAEGLTDFTIAPVIAEALLTDELTQAATIEFEHAAKGGRRI